MDMVRKHIKAFMLMVLLIVACFCMWNAEMVHADERSDEGTAYAVLTDDGELVLFRSNETYTAGTGKTVTDIKGNTYTGRVYTGIETTNIDGTSNSKWFSQRTLIKSVRIANGQKIKPINCYYWFAYCSNLIDCNLSGLDTSSVINMNYMFFGCSSLISLDVSFFDMKSVVEMEGMFGGCKELVSLSLSDWNVENVVSFGTSNPVNSGVFYNCSKLEHLDLSGWHTGSLKTMGCMFYGCESLVSVDMSNFDTSNVTDFMRLFYQCKSLETLDLSNFSTISATSMAQMFTDCSSLRELDVSHFDTSNIRSFAYMFSGCSSLSFLDISGFDTENATNFGNMFSNDRLLSKVVLGEKFSFVGQTTGSWNSSSTLLPQPLAKLNDVLYTGNWISEDKEYGPYSCTELRANYNSTMAGVWVWEEKQVSYTVVFRPPIEEMASYGGSMPDQQLKADATGTLNKCLFYRFNYHFDHWEGDNNKQYADEATIPKNTFQVGDILTLTAVFEKDDNHLNFDNGEAEIDLHGGEKVTLPDLPGGATYQIWEETPSGWQLVEQTNASGTVPANGSADATFVNEYVPGTATITLMAQKTLDGRTPADNQFSFELVDSEGTVKQTVSNNAAGMVQFSQLVFKQPGTFTYSIREVRGDDAAISYDSHVETVTITVTDDGHGNLTASTPATTDIPAFENETKPGALTVSKQTDGSGTGDETFTFVIKLTNDYGQPLDNINIVGDTEE